VGSYGIAARNRARTRFTCVRVCLGGALGDLEVVFRDNLVESVCTTTKLLASIAVAMSTVNHDTGTSILIRGVVDFTRECGSSRPLRSIRADHSGRLPSIQWP
jgi:hypothetical protein